MKRMTCAALLALAAGCGGGGEQQDDAGTAEDAGTLDAGSGGSDAAADAGEAGGDDAGEDAGGEVVELLDPDTLNTPEEAFDAVNHFIGTGGAGFGFSGLTPAAQVPLGMVKLGPDTTRAGTHSYRQRMGGYNDIDPDVRGFSHLHFVGTGVADYGNLRVSAWRDVVEPWDGWTPQDRDRQDAEPGYYTTWLPRERAEVELTTTTRGAIHRYAFEAGGKASIAIDPASSVTDTAVSDTEITYADGKVTGWLVHSRGYSARRNPFTLHYVIEVEPKPDSARIWTGEQISDGTTSSGERAGIILDWDEAPSEPVELRVGLSWVSQEGAQANFDAEVDGKTFEQVREAAKQAWLDKLGRIRVAGGRERDRTVFFSALYNAYRMPTRLDDVDGNYPGIDGQSHGPIDHPYYSDLSLWDSFRTTHPLYAMIDEQVQVDCMRSLLLMTRDGGFMPRWPAGQSYTGGMVGSSADIVFGESAAKGLQGIDWSAALDAVLLTADGDPPEGSVFGGRGDMEAYITLGYIPLSTEDETVSHTQEYALADRGVAELAKAAGRDDVAARFAARADNWRNHWDPETRFFRGKTEEGEFKPADEFNPLAYFDRGGTEYTEGTAWHWRFYVPHDPEGLIEVFGGAEALLTELETFFTKSGVGKGRVNTLIPDLYYWHGNQPPMHTSYLFAAAGDAERGAYYIDRIRELLYTTEPGGIPGNDDGGTMSSWYVFSALGFYPLAGTSRYILGGAPVFSKAVVAGREEFTVTSEPARTGDRTAHVCTLDGQDAGPYLEHAALQGSTITCGK